MTQLSSTMPIDWFVSTLGFGASGLGFLLSALGVARIGSSGWARLRWSVLSIAFLIGAAVPAYRSAAAVGLEFPLFPFLGMAGLGVVFSILAGAAVRREAENHQGFRWVLTGFWLMFIGAMLELADASGLFRGARSAVSGVESLCAVVGVISLGIGFHRWLPMIRELEVAHRDLERQKVGLESEVERRTRDLTTEVARRREAEMAALAASEAKSRFLANMSHELRTPLNAVIGFSDLLMAAPDAALDRATIRNYARDINESGLHLLEVLNDVLDLAKIEAGRMEVSAEPTGLSAAIESAMRILAPKAAERHVGITCAPAEEAIVMGDVRAIRQILINLLSNAVKFTEAGGSVTVETTVDGPHTLIRVVDTGCGIPQDKLESVFEPFEQLDNAYSKAQGGTGLGLALSRKLAQLMGGSLTLESSPGSGTAAILCLGSVGGSASMAEAA